MLSDYKPRHATARRRQESNPVARSKAAHLHSHADSQPPVLRRSKPRSGSQKCLSAPPGGAPFALSERALEKLKGRKTKPATFNLDMNLIGDYVGRGRRA
jgi:hypothetical protein